MSILHKKITGSKLSKLKFCNMSTFIPLVKNKSRFLMCLSFFWCFGYIKHLYIDKAHTFINSYKTSCCYTSILICNFYIQDGPNICTHLHSFAQYKNHLNNRSAKVFTIFTLSLHKCPI